MLSSFTALRVSPQLSCSIKLTMSRRNLPPAPFQASRTLTSAAEMKTRCRWSSPNQTRIRAHAKQPSVPLVSMISAENLAEKVPQSLENCNGMNTSRPLLYITTTPEATLIVSTYSKKDCFFSSSYLVLNKCTKHVIRFTCNFWKEVEMDSCSALGDPHIIWFFIRSEVT